MAMYNSKQYAPGVEFSEGECTTVFEGRAAPLVAAGVIKQSWLPGEPGNAKSSTSVVLDGEGNGIVLPPKSRGKKCDVGFGYLQIRKSGSLFRVIRGKTKKDKERQEAERLAARASETWAISKELSRQQRDYAGEWKRGTALKAREVGNLANGTACFSGLPNIELGETDRKAILEAVDRLVVAINQSAPFVKPAKQVDDNVIRLADHAHRGMRQTG